MRTSFSVQRVSLLLGLVLFAGLAILRPGKLLSNIYELFLVAVLAGLYWFLRWRQRLHSVSFIAIVSLTTAILNPAVTQIIFKVTGLPSIGVSELGSFGFGLLAAITGHVALVRIRRANPPVQGRVAAWFGLVIGYLWVVGWLSFYGYLLWMMAGWR